MSYKVTPETLNAKMESHLDPVHGRGPSILSAYTVFPRSSPIYWKLTDIKWIFGSVEFVHRGQVPKYRHQVFRTKNEN